MVPTLPEIQINSRYELKDVAAILGVSPSTIQRWTRKGLIRCQYRKVNNRRVWTGMEIMRIWKAMY